MASIRVKGEYQDSLRTGKWKYYSTSKLFDKSKEILRCVEEYKNGQFIKGNYYWGDGNGHVEKRYSPVMNIYPETNKFQKIDKWKKTNFVSIADYPYLKFLPELDSSILPVDSPAMFPGGLDKLAKFVSRKINLTESYIGSQKLRSAHIEIIIDASGKLKIQKHSESKAFKDNNIFVMEVLKVIKQSPQWTPATRNEKPVTNYQTVIIRMDSGKISAMVISKNANSK